jgi:hypothetical protein
MAGGRAALAHQRQSVALLAETTATVSIHDLSEHLVNAVPQTEPTLAWPQDNDEAARTGAVDPTAEVAVRYLYRWDAPKRPRSPAV